MLSVLVVVMFTPSIKQIFDYFNDGHCRYLKATIEDLQHVTITKTFHTDGKLFSKRTMNKHTKRSKINLYTYNNQGERFRKYVTSYEDETDPRSIRTTRQYQFDKQTGAWIRLNKNH